MKKIILGIAATVLFSTASFAKSGEQISKPVVKVVSEIIDAKFIDSNDITWNCHMNVKTYKNGVLVSSINYYVSNVESCYQWRKDLGFSQSLSPTN